MKFKAIFFIFAVTAFLGCKKSSTDPVTKNEILKDKFTDEPGGWSVDFVDYPKGKEVEWKLEGGIANLPTPLDVTLKGLRVSGFNHSDDLFMFLKKKITGLQPNQTYTVNLEVAFASNAPSNAVGVGGAPGESVLVKAGLTAIEPVKELQSDGYYRLNLDKGNQSLSGKDLFSIDHIGNGTSEAKYKLLNKTGTFSGTSNDKGEAWIVIGTDSGYESTTTLFYTNVKVTIDH